MVSNKFYYRSLPPPGGFCFCLRMSCSQPQDSANSHLEWKTAVHR